MDPSIKEVPQSDVPTHEISTSHRPSVSSRHPRHSKDKDKSTGSRRSESSNKAKIVTDPELGISRKSRSGLSIGSTTTQLLPGQKFYEKGRLAWPNRLDSIIAHEVFSIGISTISRFPLTSFSLGGTAFFIPYAICLIVFIYPLLVLECFVGQFVQQGFISVWKIVPIFKGIGYCILAILWLSCSYYLTSLTWGFVYITDSFNSSIPYLRCDSDWNSMDNCIVPTKDNYKADVNASLKSTAGREYFRGKVLRLWPSKYSDEELLSEEERRDLLGIVENDNNNSTIFGFRTKLGTVNWDLFFWDFFIYTTYFIIILFGLRICRKIPWVTSTIPPVILAVLFFRGLTLPGAIGGLKKALKPNFKVLLSPNVWATAALNLLFGVGPGCGVHLTLASFRGFKQDLHLACFWACLGHFITCIFSSLVIYCYLGHIADIQGKNITQLIEGIDGTDLMYEFVPDAIGKLSGGRFFIFIFFVAIFMLGFHTMMFILVSVVQGFMDEFRQWLPEHVDGSRIINFSLTYMAFVISLLSCTRGGIWVYKFMDQYTGGLAFAFVVFLQVIVITWIWGMDELCNAIEAMTGNRPGIFLRLCWKVICPISLFSLSYVLLVGLFKSRAKNYNGESAPSIEHTIGIYFSFFPLIWMPIYAIYQMITYPGKNFKEKMRFLFYPENEHFKMKNESLYEYNRFTYWHFFSFGNLMHDLKELQKHGKKKVHPKLKGKTTTVTIEENKHGELEVESQISDEANLTAEDNKKEISEVNKDIIDEGADISHANKSKQKQGKEAKPLTTQSDTALFKRRHSKISKNSKRGPKK